jgi:hypothetical protein
VSDFLSEKREEIARHLDELKPLVDEYRRLEAAAAALTSVGGSRSVSARGVTTGRRGPGLPRGAARPTGAAVKPKSAAKPGREAGRPATRRAGSRMGSGTMGSGTRAAQALSFVQGQPGITIPELAAKMGIKQNYLYRVLPGLEQEGNVYRRGRCWYARGWDRNGP